MKADMKNYYYFNFGLLLLVLPAWMLINECKPKYQEIDFISNEASLANSKLYVKGFITGLDTFYFNRHNHQEAFINNDTIEIS